MFSSTNKKVNKNKFSLKACLGIQLCTGKSRIYNNTTQSNDTFYDQTCTDHFATAPTATTNDNQLTFSSIARRQTHDITPIKINRDQLRKVKARSNLRPFAAQVTALDQSKIEISKLPLLISTPTVKSNKLTSTVNKPNKAEFFSPSLSKINAYHNETYDSPTFRSSTDSLCSVSDCSYCDFSSDDIATFSQSYNLPENFVSGSIYICKIAHIAASSTELRMQFADRVKLVQIQQNLCLVQNIVSGQYGFVPRHCISDINTFLRDMAYIQAQRQSRLNFA